MLLPSLRYQFKIIIMVILLVQEILPKDQLTYDNTEVIILIISKTVHRLCYGYHVSLLLSGCCFGLVVDGGGSGDDDSPTTVADDIADADAADAVVVVAVAVAIDDCLSSSSVVELLEFVA